MKILQNFLRFYCNKSVIKIKKISKDGYKKSQFVDYKVVNVKAGDGGDGSVALLHEFANEFAGPCGGNGGNGGHVIFEGCSETGDLSGIDSIINGHDGIKGSGKSLDGANGKFKIIKVPVGTVIRCFNSGDHLSDIDQDLKQLVVVRGGVGGKGNKFFLSDTHSIPTIAERGGKGDSKKISLEVKLLADIGLVGVPNAGKSTLLRSLTRARPKVASYAFTTLRPHVGSIDFCGPEQERVTICDIPGIVEDAHKNYGLGLEFLRHIERCRALAFILDLSEDPIEQYSVLMDELGKYRPLLLSLPRIVVCNKIDVPSTRGAFNKLCEYHNRYIDPEGSSSEIVAISALNQVNLQALVQCFYRVKIKFSDTSSSSI